MSLGVTSVSLVASTLGSVPLGKLASSSCTVLPLSVVVASTPGRAADVARKRGPAKWNANPVETVGGVVVGSIDARLGSDPLQPVLSQMRCAVKAISEAHVLLGNG